PALANLRDWPRRGRPAVAKLRDWRSPVLQIDGAVIAFAGVGGGGECAPVNLCDSRSFLSRIDGAVISVAFLFCVGGGSALSHRTDVGSGPVAGHGGNWASGPVA